MSNKTLPLAASRRSILHMGVAAAVVPASMASGAQAVRVEVWKDPTCGCCEGWVKHMRAAGFEATVHDVADLQAVKAVNGVPDALQSCHTAIVGGYVIEGHVPAADVRRLLAERPHAKGLAAPGMPPSSPGMDMPGTPYEVVLFGVSGGDRLWARH
jgi:hypothetical protein